MRTKAEFLREWMQSNSIEPSTKSWKADGPLGKHLSGSPSFYIFVDMDYFGLLSPVEWIPAAYPRDILIVPTGFVTDFASVPRLFWSIFPPIGTYGYAALFHDYVYWEQRTPRADADRVFRDTMKELGVSKLVTFILYRSVRLFGLFAWHNNNKAKQSGEKRVLKRFPPDFKTSWKVWKCEPDVFQ
jgi:hypothetical protein